MSRAEGQENNHSDTDLFVIGWRLRQAREAAGWTQTECANLADVKSWTWNRWEAGRRRPDCIAVALWVGRVGLSMDWIYRGILAPTVNPSLAEKLEAVIPMTPKPRRHGAKRRAPSARKIAKAA